MNKYFAILSVAFVAVAALVGGLFGRLPSRISADASVTGERVTSDYVEALDVIDQNYAGTVDHENDFPRHAWAKLRRRRGGEEQKSPVLVGRAWLVQ